jgi:hypothetical protein
LTQSENAVLNFFSRTHVQLSDEVFDFTRHDLLLLVLFLGAGVRSGLEFNIHFLHLAHEIQQLSSVFSSLNQDDVFEYFYCSLERLRDHPLIKDGLQ